jgi:hypothetical protein
MTSKIDEQVEFANSANEAPLLIAGNTVGALTEIGRLNPWNLLSLWRAKRIARITLERRTVQLRKG